MDHLADPVNSGPAAVPAGPVRATLVVRVAQAVRAAVVYLAVVIVVPVPVVEEAALHRFRTRPNQAISLLKSPRGAAYLIVVAANRDQLQQLIRKTRRQKAARAASLGG